MSKEVKRYSYGYVDDGNGNRYLGLIEKPDGNLVKHDDYESLLAERDRLRDALDHIARTCRASRTSTRRTRWVECRAEWALEGKTYTDNAFDIPVDVEEKNRTLRIKKNLLKAVVRDLLDVAECSHPNPPAAIEAAHAALQGEQP